MLLVDEIFEIPDGSLVTGIWLHKPDASARRLLFTAIDLPDDQDPHVESHVVSEHVDLVIGGIYGRYPDGCTWLILASAGADPKAAICHVNPFVDPRTVTVNRTFFDDDLSRALGPAAPLAAFAQVALLETLGLSIEQCVAAVQSECAFPGSDHECVGDGFTDICAAWCNGELRRLLEESD